MDVGSAGTEIDDTIADGGNVGENNVHNTTTSSRRSKKGRLSPEADTPLLLFTQPSHSASASATRSGSTRSIRNNQSIAVAASSSSSSSSSTTEHNTNSRSTRSSQKKSPSIQFSDCIDSSSNSKSNSAMDIVPTSVPAKPSSARRIRGNGSSSSGNGGGNGGSGSGSSAMEVDEIVTDRCGMEGQWSHEGRNERRDVGSSGGSSGNGGLMYDEEVDQEDGPECDPTATADAYASDVHGVVSDDKMLGDDGVYDEGYYGADSDGHEVDVVDGDGDGDQYHLSAPSYGSIEDDPGNLLVERCRALLWRQLQEYNNLGHLTAEEDQIKMRLKSAFDRRVSTSILVVGNTGHRIHPLHTGQGH